MRNMQHRFSGLVGLEPVALYGADGDENDENVVTDPQEGAGGDGTNSSENKEMFDADYVKKLRNEAAKYRVSDKNTTTELEAVRKKLADIEKAEMSDLEGARTDLETATTDLEKATVRASAAESSLKTERIRNAVTMAALEAGLEDPSDALSMISQDDLVDDEGNIDGKTVKAKLKALASKKPYLLKSHRPGSGDGAGAGKPGDPDTFEAKERAYLEQYTKTGGRVVV